LSSVQPRHAVRILERDFQCGRRIGVDEIGPRFIPDVQKNKSVAFLPGFFEHHVVFVAI
jgi:hypothetical protein